MFAFAYDMIQDEDAQMEADYEAYLAEREYAEWERQAEDEVYNNHILPEYFSALDESTKEI